MHLWFQLCLCVFRVILRAQRNTFTNIKNKWVFFSPPEMLVMQEHPKATEGGNLDLQLGRHNHMLHAGGKSRFCWRGTARRAAHKGSIILLQMLELLNEMSFNSQVPKFISNLPACVVKSVHTSRWWVLSLEIISAKIWKATTSLGNKVIHPIQVFKPFHSTNTNKLTLSSKTPISNFPYLIDLSKTLPISLPIGLKRILSSSHYAPFLIWSIYVLIWFEYNLPVLSLLKVPRVIKWCPLLGGWTTVLTTQGHNELAACYLLLPLWVHLPEICTHSVLMFSAALDKKHLVANILSNYYNNTKYLQT